jgi:1-acyl-sn-glycerol-3-phosphate acyltransferase
VNKQQLKDGKHPGAAIIWGPVNYLAVKAGLKRVKVTGLSEIPPSGAFLLVCNHVSRWDGLIVQKLIGRPANFMVSPNELKGLQGRILRSMGAFPADSRYDLLAFAVRQAAKGEPLVVFPEGDICRLGVTKRFKSGAARLSLACAEAGLKLPVIPMAIDEEFPRSFRVIIGQAIDISAYGGPRESSAVQTLTMRLNREVDFLRQSWGKRDTLFMYRQLPKRKWVLPSGAPAFKNGVSQ